MSHRFDDGRDFRSQRVSGRLGRALERVQPRPHIGDGSRLRFVKLAHTFLDILQPQLKPGVLFCQDTVRLMDA